MILSLIGIAAAETWDRESEATILSYTGLYVESHSPPERLYWDLEGGATITDPDGNVVKLDDSGIMSLQSAGQWKIVLNQDLPSDWYIEVRNLSDVPQSGRVFSYDWNLNTNGSALYEWFYVPVPLTGDDPFADSVQIVKINAEGLIGEAIQISASRTGLQDSPGYSNLTDSSIHKLPIFIEWPDFFTSGKTGTSAITFGEPEYESNCGMVIPGDDKHAYTISIPISVTGHAQPRMVCDLNNDGSYDASGGTDLALFWDAVTEGTTTLEWDGYDALGEPLTVSGSLSCALSAGLAPIHALVHGAHVASPGIRLHTSPSPDSAQSMSMMWNDAMLNSKTDINGSPPLSAPGVSGILSGTLTYATDYGTTCTEASSSNCSAHGWGVETDSGYTYDAAYSAAWVDTWSAISGEEALITIVLADTSDEDSDGLPYDVEVCLGSDPSNADSDGDSLDDGDEVGGDWNSPLDHDDDNIINALDEDDDGDSVFTYQERRDTDDAGLSWNVDSDADDDDNWHDTDADNDGIVDGDEPTDADGSGIPDYLENDAAQTDSGVLTDSDTSSDGDASPEDLVGNYQGGACQCAPASGKTAGLLSGLVFLAIAGRRRKT